MRNNPFIAKLFEMQAVRFFLMSLVGVVADLAVATAVLIALKSSAYVASICGFSVGVVVAYAGHQKCTFGTRESKLALSRFAGFACTSLLVIGVRLCVIYLGKSAFNGSVVWLDQALLVGAVGVSFCVNFVVSKFVVFRESALRE